MKSNKNSKDKTVNNCVELLWFEKVCGKIGGRFCGRMEITILINGKEASSFFIDIDEEKKENNMTPEILAEKRDLGENVVSNDSHTNSDGFLSKTEEKKGDVKLSELVSMRIEKLEKINNELENIIRSGAALKESLIEVPPTESGKYSALDVAKYIVNYAKNESERPITNLKLQKILYFVQLKFLGNGNLCIENALFGDNIEAWRYGPVVSDVYSYYNEFSDRPITNFSQPSADFTENESLQMDSVIDEYIGRDQWDLVEMTHSEGPWGEVYADGEGKTISLESMIKYLEKRRATLER